MPGFTKECDQQTSHSPVNIMVLHLDWGQRKGLERLYHLDGGGGNTGEMSPGLSNVLWGWEEALRVHLSRAAPISVKDFNYRLQINQIVQL